MNMNKIISISDVMAMGYGIYWEKIRKLGFVKKMSEIIHPIPNLLKNNDAF